MAILVTFTPALHYIEPITPQAAGPDRSLTGLTRPKATVTCRAASQQLLDLGHVGSAGAVCKFFKAKMATWPEMVDLSEQLRSKQSVVGAVISGSQWGNATAISQDRIRALLDMRFMHVWPKQGKLAKMFCLFCFPCNSRCAYGGMTTATTTSPPSNG